MPGQDVNIHLFAGHTPDSTAKIAIKEGMSDELIAKLTGFTESQINIIRKSINN